VDQLRCLALLAGLMICSRRPLRLELQVPVIDQHRRRALPFSFLALIGADRGLPVPVHVLEVTRDRSQALPSLVQHPDHDLRRPADGPRNEGHVRRRQPIAALGSQPTKAADVEPPPAAPYVNAKPWHDLLPRSVRSRPAVP